MVMGKCKDGTDLLCRAVYRREAQPSDYLGGSDARMLVDAAKEIHVQRRRLASERYKWAKEKEVEVLGLRSEAEDLRRVLQDLCVLALQDHRYHSSGYAWRALVDEGLALTIQRRQREEG